jgi:Lrp/AsnC family transcriptional regulator for asnA, asnC and gidA
MQQNEGIVNLDELDKKILDLLQQDGRMAYTEIAKKLIVSHGTIHQRINRLEELGIITGTKATIDYQKLGYDVTTLLGIHLKSAKDQARVIEKLKLMKEVVEVYYTTGAYALIIKVHNKTIKDFHFFLAEKLQSISEIQSTESFICLDSPLRRHLIIS